MRIFSLAVLIASCFVYNSVGSIDEQALQNISLVVNLTKHIQLKASGIQDEIDPEELSKYFPSFMWVVRDFALKLVDKDEEKISPKEYLEKALNIQKGFSEQVESKNKIRNVIKSMFKERDCCVMVRPLTNEGDLQHLTEKSLEELRPEFIDQVTQLRRKVLNRVKPKMMNGMKLNGQMIMDLLTSYVDAINRGAVPNIQQAWIYICKNEC